jgi:hypothetical protein
MPDLPAGPPPAPDLAHDMRNHLTGIVNALEVVRLVAGGDPAVARALAAADRQAEALGRLVDEVQRLGRRG